MDVGAAHESETWVFPGVAESDCGADGVPFMLKVASVVVAVLPWASVERIW